MKRTRIFFLLLLVVCFAKHASAAIIETPASHAILVDAATGTVLLDKEANVRMPTSSMSKTMTIYMAFDALKAGRIKLSDTFRISEKAWRMGGSRMFIREGTRVKVEDLIRGVVVQSGNDAAVALAEGLAGTEQSFAEAMNIRAKQLGMNSSNFANASGWPHPDHYSTPRDLALLAYRIIYDFPEYYPYFAEKTFTYNKIKQPNRDPLLTNLPGADGLKTGHTDAAGYGLIGSAIRANRRIILVVNGLNSEKQRKEESIRLLEWGFRNFENRQIVNKGQEVDTAPVWLGSQISVPLVASQNLSAVLPVSQRDNIKMTITYKSPLKAPLAKGEIAGALHIDVPEQPAVEIDLVTGAAVPMDSLFGRAKSRLGYLLTGVH